MTSELVIRVLLNKKTLCGEIFGQSTAHEPLSGRPHGALLYTLPTHREAVELAEKLVRDHNICEPSRPARLEL